MSEKETKQAEVVATEAQETVVETATAEAPKKQLAQLRRRN